MWFCQHKHSKDQSSQHKKSLILMIRPRISSQLFGVTPLEMLKFTKLILGIFRKEVSLKRLWHH